MPAPSHSMPGRPNRVVILLALVLLPLVACRKESPAGRYQKHGLTFEHLAGWTVTGDERKKVTRTVMIEGPQHAVLAISIFQPHLEVSLERSVEAGINARRASLKKTLTVAGVNLGAEVAGAAPTPMERSIAGTMARGLEDHFTVEIIRTPVPHTAEFLTVTLADRPLIFMDQVADKNRAVVNPGFQKIFDTVALER